MRNIFVSKVQFLIIAVFLIFPPSASGTSMVNPNPKPTFPELKFDSSWKVVENSVPSIERQFRKTIGRDSLDVNFTSYSVPEINSEADMKAYVQAQYPNPIGENPRVDFLKNKSCKSRFEPCYSTLIRLTRGTDRRFIGFIYFRHGAKNYVGLSALSGHADNQSRATKIQSELENALAK